MAAWFEQDGLTEYTATYRSLSAWQRERDVAAQHGWTTRSRSPRPNKQGAIVIHYHRSASAEARARIEHAMAHVAVTGSALPAQERALAEALRQLRAHLTAARTDETRDPVALESQVLQSAQRLVRERQGMQEAHRGHLGALSRAEVAHAHARTVRGAKVDDLPGVDASERSRRTIALSRGDELLRAERAFQDAQVAVVSAVKDWQQAIGRRWDSSHRRARLAEKVAERHAAVPEEPVSDSTAEFDSATAAVSVVVAQSDGTSPSGAASESPRASKPHGTASGVSLLDRWRGWQLRRLEGRLADEGARLEQLEGLVTVQQQAVIAALQARDAAAGGARGITRGTGGARGFVRVREE